MKAFVGFLVRSLLSGLVLMLTAILGVGLTALIVHFAVGSFNPLAIGAVAFLVAFPATIGYTILTSYAAKDGDRISHYEGWASGNRISMRPVTRGEQAFLYLFLAYWGFIAFLTSKLSPMFLSLLSSLPA
jgi:hypothetical protein